MSPDKHTHVLCTGDEGVHRLRGVLHASFIDSWFSDPLKSGDFLEMAKLMAHNRLTGTVNWPIDHHKRLVWVLDHEVSHIECSGYKSNRGPYFEYGELITLQVVIDILVVLIIQQLVRSASCPQIQSLVQCWVSVQLEILKQGQLIRDFIDELQWCHVEDTDCSPICTKEDLIIGSRPDNSKDD